MLSKQGLNDIFKALLIAALIGMGNLVFASQAEIYVLRSNLIKLETEVKSLKEGVDNLYILNYIRDAHAYKVYGNPDYRFKSSYKDFTLSN